MLLDDKAQKAQIGRQWLQAAACLTRLGLSSVHTAWSTQLMYYTQKIADTEFKSRTKKLMLPLISQNVTCLLSNMWVQSTVLQVV